MIRAFDKDADRVVVIGAGIAGLATAVRLVSAGARVTLLERHAHLGGKIRTTPSDAGPVDAGPTVLTMRHVFDDLFASAGAALDDHVTLVPQHILARHFWPDGSQLDLLADRGATIDAISGFAGSRAAQDFDKFCDRAEKLFNAFDLPMMQSPEPKLSALVRHVMQNPSLIGAMSPLSTLAGVLHRQFGDLRLQQLFGRYATYVGGAPHLSPAVLALIWHAEAQGVWVVKGGMHKLAQALARLATNLGVEIVNNAHVEEVLMRANRVQSVRLIDGTSFPADVVVFAGDPRALATGELGPNLEHVASPTRSQPRSFSARVHSFAARVSGPDLAHHNVFFSDQINSEFADLMDQRIPEDPTLYLCAEDRGYPTRQAGLERFEIIANAPATQTTSRPKDLDQWHQKILTRLTRFGVHFSPKPDPTTVTCPQNFADLFPASMGALYGQSPHGLMAAFKRPTARTPIQGLYLCGGGTHPGAGVPMATLSARHAVEAILKDRTSTSRSAQTAMHGGMSTA